MTTTGASTAGEVRVTEIDGVPAVWADVPGPYAAGILVRVGHVDETLARHGITHMLEHLALYGLDRPGDHSNGSVDATTLSLHVAAEPNEVAQFLARATRQLLDPPVVRLEEEKGVLRTESAQRSGHPFGEVLTWRWGAVGYGMEILPEYGLSSMTAETVREWAATRVNRQNAVLWFTGPPPAGLRLELPDGPRHFAPNPYASPLPRFPSYFNSNAGVSIVHGLVRRNPAAVALAGILRDRLVDELRVKRAAAYSPDAGYRPVSGEVASVIAHSDIVNGRAIEVVEQVMTAVGHLALPEATARPEELENYRRIVRRSLAVTDVSIVTSSAWNLLHGAPVKTIAEMLDDLQRITPQDVQAAANELGATLLAQVPTPVTVPGPWTAAPVSIGPPIFGGRSHASLAHETYLRVTPEGVALTAGAPQLTIRREQIELLGRWDDGGRLLVSKDGVHLTIEPTLWYRGHRAVAAIDALAPAEKQIPLGPRAAEAVPHVSPTQLLRRLRVPLGVTAGALLFFLLVVAMELSGLPSP